MISHNSSENLSFVQTYFLLHSNLQNCAKIIFRNISSPQTGRYSADTAFFLTFFSTSQLILRGIYFTLNARKQEN